MTAISEKAAGFWRRSLGLLRTRRETGPIDSVAKLRTSSPPARPMSAQKTLYGYVKTRMGIRYPAMFEDDKIIASLNIAKMHVFAACLSDLTVYAVAKALHDRPVGNDEREAMARRLLSRRLARQRRARRRRNSRRRTASTNSSAGLPMTDWRRGALTPENFTDSPRALLRWAPIADKLKKFDAEIIENSVKFAWRDIREQFRKRIDARRGRRRLVAAAGHCRPG